MAYTAYVLTEEARREVLKAFPPRFPDVIAHHVTREFGVPKNILPPAKAVIEVYGYVADDSLEALLVTVNGEPFRPDKGLYHITLSLERSKGRKPVQSNDVIRTSVAAVIVERPTFETTSAVLQ